MREKRKTQVIKIFVVTGFLCILAFGWIVADAVTRPQSVHLRSHIKICRQTNEGKWEQIDEAGPAVLNFTADLLDLATSSKRATTSFVWDTKTKNGKNYTVRLAGPADINYNPVNGVLQGTFAYDITYDGRSARVAGKLTTESINSPVGILKGKRAKGVFGIQQSEFTFVSVNEFPGETPLRLVCEEHYRLTPRQ